MLNWGRGLRKPVSEQLMHWSFCSIDLISAVACICACIVCSSNAFERGPNCQKEFLTLDFLSLWSDSDHGSSKSDSSDGVKAKKKKHKSDHQSHKKKSKKNKHHRSHSREKSEEDVSTKERRASVDSATPSVKTATGLVCAPQFHIQGKSLLDQDVKKTHWWTVWRLNDSGT